MLTRSRRPSFWEAMRTLRLCILTSDTLNPPRRVARIAGLSFAGAFLVVGIGLSRLEFLIVERGVGPRIPIHVLFTLLFVPATILVVGIVGFVFGREFRGPRFGMELAVRSAIPAGLARSSVRQQQMMGAEKTTAEG